MRAAQLAAAFLLEETGLAGVEADGAAAEELLFAVFVVDFLSALWDIVIARVLATEIVVSRLRFVR